MDEDLWFLWKTCERHRLAKRGNVVSLPKLVLCLILFSSVPAIPAHAQHGGGRAGGGRHAGGYHGGGPGGYYGGHYGGYYVGHYGYYGGRRYYGPRGYFGFGFGYPYYGYYPPYYGYRYYYGYRPYYYGYYPYPYGSNPAYFVPPVSIQQNYYESGPPRDRRVTLYHPQTQQHPQVQPSNSEKQKYYLIAFTNDLIEAAMAYNVEGDQIHWLPQEDPQKQAPPSTVEVLFSRQVNRDRGVDSKIP